MWFVLMAVLGVFALLGGFYLLTRFHRFSFVQKIGKKNSAAAWITAAVPVLLLGLFYLFNVTTLMVVVLHFMLGFALCDLIFFIIKKISKREIKYDIRGAVAIAVTVIYLGIGWFCAHHIFETRYTFYTDKALKEDIRIIEIADSHLGITLDGEAFAKQIERIQSANPDIVVLAGDFVDDDSDRKDMITACAALGKLKTKYGVYFVYGNHDDGYFNYRNFSSEELRNNLTQNGVIILEDRALLTAGDFYVIGRLDRSSPHRAPAADLTADLDKTKYSVMLDHQPNDYAAEAAASPDLVLSGHTHGGHIFPAGLVGLIMKANDCVWGTERRQNTDFVVTSGLSGWAIPFKTGTYSEYVIIDVKKEK